MKALIYKDLLAVWNYCRSFIFMCAMFLLFSVVLEEYRFLQMYPSIFTFILLNTIIAYDERDRWDRQVLAMPVSRKQYVTAKYLVSVVLQAVVLILTATAHALQLLRTGSFSWENIGITAVIVMLFGTLPPAMFLPFIFKAGVEKGRIAYMIAAGCGCGLGGAGMKVLNTLGMMDKPVGIGFAPVAMVLALLLFCGSWALSVKWYEKREL